MGQLSGYPQVSPPLSTDLIPLTRSGSVKNIQYVNLGATSSNPGVVQLAGDLGGTSVLPQTLSRTTTVTVGTTGQAADYICDGTADDVQINAAATFLNSIGGGILFIRKGTYNLTANISIATFSYIKFKGEGMGVTILLGAGISKNNSTVTSGIEIEDLTINVNNVSGFNGVNLTTNSYNFKLTRVELRNSNNRFLMAWGGVDNLIVRDCIIYDSGLVVGSDNCAGGQLTTTNGVSKFINNTIIKEFSIGGGLITTGATGNILLQGNTLLNISGTAYAAISIEDQTGPSKSFTITDNYVFNAGIGIGIGAHLNNNNYATVANNIIEIDTSNPAGGNTISAQLCKEVVISGNTISNSVAAGIACLNNSLAIVSNNIIQNTNVLSSSFTSDKGGIALTGGNVTKIENNIVVSTIGTTPYGLRWANDTSSRLYVNNNALVGPFISNSLIIANTLTYLEVNGNDLVGTLSLSTITTLKGFNNNGLNPIILFNQGNITGATTFTVVNGHHIVATLTGNITTTITNGVVKGDKLILELTQDGTGSRTISKPANVKLVGGAFSPTATAGAVDVWLLEWDGSSWVEVSRSLNVS